jgi:glycosyltransferase involved in cell wall biosynthesis
MHSAPLVSVIALCFNHARFVTACLDSLRAQHYPNIEVILCDDASRDNSVEVIKHWLDDTGFACRFIQHAENRGLCSTINEALTHARGKYVTLIATDDTWELDRLVCSVECLENSTEDVGVAFTDVYQMDESGERLPQTFLESLLGSGAIPQGDLLDRLVQSNFIPAMGALIRRSVYADVGAYDESLLYEDWDFWLRVAMHYRFVYVDGPSANYRIVATSMARTHLANDSVASLHTYYLIHRKLLTQSRLNEVSRALVLERLADTARELYAKGFKKLPRSAGRHIFQSRRRGAAKMAMLSMLGIPWAEYCKWHNYVSWKLDVLRSAFRQ